MSTTGQWPKRAKSISVVSCVCVYVLQAEPLKKEGKGGDKSRLWQVSPRDLQPASLTKHNQVAKGIDSSH